MLYFVHCLVLNGSWALIGFFAVFLFNFDAVFSQFLNSLVDPCLLTLYRPIITSNSSEDLKVSKTTKCASLNFEGTCINYAQDSKNLCIWCNSAAMKISWINNLTLNISLNMSNTEHQTKHIHNKSAVCRGYFHNLKKVMANVEH